MKRQKRGDAGRTLARLVCALLAIVGALPLLLALVVRTSYARAWAAKLTTEILATELSLSATFQAELQAFPPSVVVRDLVVPATDGGGPALAVDRIRVVPRVFSLLGGRLDAGDIEVERPRVRVIVEGGEVTNVHYRLPPSSTSTKTKRPPFRSLAVTQASLDVTLPGPRVAAVIEDLDVDVSAEDGPMFDGAVRLSRGRVRRHRSLPGGGDAVDDDALCDFHTRVHVDDGAVLVRRLELAARLDDDPAEGPAPSCDGEATGEAAIDLALSRLRIAPGPGAIPITSGHVTARAPLRLLARIIPDAPAITGDVGIDTDIATSGLPELPSARGRLLAHEVFFMNRRTFAHSLDARFETTPDEVRLVEAKVAWGGGDVTIRGARAQPLAPGIPLELAELDFDHLKFPALLADVGITKHTLIDWSLDSGSLRNFHGLVLDPVKKGPSLSGDISAQTSGFEVGDRSWDDPARRHIVAVPRAFVRGKFGFEHNAMVLRNMSADFGHSHADVPLVMVGFLELLEVRIGAGTKIDLGEISPLATVPVAGKIEVEALVHGSQSHPRIDGDLKGTGFKLGELPMADTVIGHAEFVPYAVEFTKLHATKGKSAYDAPLVRLDLNRSDGVLVDAQVAGKELDLRDMLAMFLFEQDPRFTEITGKADAKVAVHYETGTPADACHTGVISVRVESDMRNLGLYGERYDSGNVDMDYIWFDRAAEERGVEATVRSLTLKKGQGTIFGGGAVRKGGEVRGHFVAHDVPISKVDALGALGAAMDGTISANGEVSGTLDALAADAQVTMSPVRIGQKRLPSSSFAVKLAPSPRKTGSRGTSRCGEEIPLPWSRAEYDKDEALGVFHVTGDMFGGQIALTDVQSTRQSHKRVSGRVDLKKLDLGAVVQLSPAMVLNADPPRGEMTGRVDLASLELDHPERARVKVALDDLSVSRGGYRAHLHPREAKSAVEAAVEDDGLTFTPLSLDVTSPQGVTATFGLRGKMRHLSSTREIDAEADLAPLDLAALGPLFPRIESAAGKLTASLSLSGRMESPVARGELRLSNGELSVRGAPLALADVNLLARIDERELTIVSATAKAGGGSVSITGRAPLRGFELGEMSVRMAASDVRMPVVDGVDMTIRANVAATWSPSTSTGPRKKVDVTGNVDIASFLYTRPITISADFDSLAKRGKRTEVAVYDPEDDFVDFAVTVRPLTPLVFRNNLLEAEVVLDSDALVLSGTNQRFGMRGALRVVKGGRLRFRSNEFDIRQGTIRFDDPTRVQPHVDLTAMTDYRRYTTSSTSSAPAAGAAAGAGAAGAGRAGGSWRIGLHAHGDADDLKIDLSSEPTLAQEDIVLLLTIGMTRAELDQLQAANLGSAAALEALSALSGADTAVKTAIPLVDDFRFGSAYSTRTGRTEPTLTVGKRVSDRVRANVTSGLAENRDVRSNVEWRLTPQTSVLGNYDNLSDVTSQGLGNLGADFRIRLEF